MRVQIKINYDLNQDNHDLQNDTFEPNNSLHLHDDEKISYGELSNPLRDFCG